MITAEKFTLIVNGASRKPRAPVEPRGHCPHCGKKGLGNTYQDRTNRRYRQCTYCDELNYIDGAK